MRPDALYHPDGRPLTLADLIRAEGTRRPWLFKPEEPTMRPELERISSLRAALAAARDPDARKAELAEKMKPFEAEWKYAPESERVKATRRIAAEQQQRIEAAALALLREVDAVDPIIRGEVAAAMDAPSPLVAHVRRFQQDGVTSTEAVLVGIRHELELARLDRTLRGAPAGDVYTAYRTARAAGDSTTLDYIEARGARLCAPSDDPETGAAVLALAREITETRAGRVPEDLRQAEQLLQDARAAVDRVQDLAHDPRQPAATTAE